MLSGAGVANEADGAVGAEGAVAGMIWVISGRYPTRGYPGSGGQGFSRSTSAETALHPAENLSGSDRGNLGDPSATRTPARRSHPTIRGCPSVTPLRREISIFRTSL